jgi:hypothetical protein
VTPMAAFEVGTRDGQVVLILTVTEDASIGATGVTMDPDEARAMVNALGEAIKDVARMAMT